MLIGLPSAGLHTNGYSLARRVLFDVARLQAGRRPSGAGRDGRRRAARAAPFVSARRAAAARAGSGQGHGAHHRRRHHREPAADAAGGLRGRRSTLRRGRCRRSSGCLQSAGAIATDEMFRAFNMGIGLIVVCRGGGRASACSSVLTSGGRRPIARRACRRRRSLVEAGDRARDPVSLVNRRLGVLISGPRQQPAIDHRRDCRRRARRARLPSSSRIGPMRPGLLRARDAGIEALCLNPRDYPDRDAYDRAHRRDPARAATSDWSVSPGSCGSSVRRCSRRFPIGS